MLSEQTILLYCFSVLNHFETKQKVNLHFLQKHQDRMVKMFKEYKIQVEFLLHLVL
jgi:hypothetical protein